MSDFDSLDLPCRPGMGCPCREAERESIVTWLSSQYRTANGSFTHAIAEEIRNGKHLAGDDV